MRETREGLTCRKGAVVGAVLALAGMLTSGMGADQTTTAPRPAESQVAAGKTAMLTTARVTAPWAGRINTLSKAAVNDSFKRRYRPYTSVPSGFLGLGCLLGIMSSSSHAATLSSVNYVRALTGLMPVSFGNATMNRKALQAALIMQNNGRLSHDPLTSWLCYTLGGDEAAHRSNLALSYPGLGSGQAIDLYMDDPGSSNTAVGHRRWVLYPFTTVMGNGTTRNANALTVIGPTSTSRSNPRWVRWPTNGYFPRPLEPGGRWSLSSGIRGDNFSRAWVRMWKNGARIYPRKHAVRNGYGMPTIVWQLPAGVERSGTFTVQVGNICRSGAGCFSTKYVVRIFNPY